MRVRNNSKWTDEDKGLLVAAAPFLTIAQTAKLLNRSQKGVISRAQIMKVKFNVTKAKPAALRKVLAFIEEGQA